MMSSHTPLEAMISSAEPIDWRDLATVEKAVLPGLQQLATDRDALRGVIETAGSDATTMQLSWAKSDFAAITLYHDPLDRFRLKLNVIDPAEQPLPHSHQMSFATVILAGAYEHTIYRQQDDGMTLLDGNQLEEKVKRTEPAGSSYVIGCETIHRVRALRPVVSLMLRGPLQRHKLMIFPSPNGKAEWEYPGPAAAAGGDRDHAERIGAAVSRALALLG
jgi:hypothetical protein